MRVNFIWADEQTHDHGTHTHTHQKKKNINGTKKKNCM
jgi:hypothetical protein